MEAHLIFEVVDHFAGRVNLRYGASDMSVIAGSKLDADRQSGNAEVRRLIGPMSSMQSIVLFLFGARDDTRDNAVTPKNGTFDEVVLKMSPGGTPAFLYRYGQATGVLRAHMPFGRTPVMLAGETF